MPNILLLNNRVPFPLKDGGAKATYSLIQGLVHREATVDCFFLNTKKHHQTQREVVKAFDFVEHIETVDINTDVSIIGALKNLIQGSSYNISRFDRNIVYQRLKEVLSCKKYDVIHFENLFMAPYLSTIRSVSSAKCVLRMHNVEHQIWEKLAQETASPIKRWYLKQLSKQLKKYEVDILPKFDAVIPISLEDTHWAKQITNKPLLNLPMGINFDTFRPQKPGKHFFHIGSMEWLPNRQGCAFLVNEVWPELVKKDPDCHLHLAGKSMDNQFNHWASEQIHIHGEVDSAKEFMLKNNVMLIPLKSASGLRIKALEAMGLGIPVISSLIGMSGLLNADNAHFIAAESIDEWVAAILNLSNNHSLHAQMAKEGYTFVQNNYDAQVVSEKLVNFYEKIIQ